MLLTPLRLPSRYFAAADLFAAAVSAMMPPLRVDFRRRCHAAILRYYADIFPVFDVISLRHDAERGPR